MYKHHTPLCTIDNIYEIDTRTQYALLPLTFINYFKFSIYVNAIKPYFNYTNVFLDKSRYDLLVLYSPMMKKKVNMVNKKGSTLV